MGIYFGSYICSTTLGNWYYHDFWSLGHGKVIPHGIYDAQENRGYIKLGNSKDTSEFACESLKNWWNNYGKFIYPNAT